MGRAGVHPPGTVEHHCRWRCRSPEQIFAAKTDQDYQSCPPRALDNTEVIGSVDTLDADTPVPHVSAVTGGPAYVDPLQNRPART